VAACSRKRRSELFAELERVSNAAPWWGCDASSLRALRVGESGERRAGVQLLMHDDMGKGVAIRTARCCALTRPVSHTRCSCASNGVVMCRGASVSV